MLWCNCACTLSWLSWLSHACAPQPHVGGPYSVFAGRECSRALGRMAVDAAECNDDLSDLDERQLKTLSDWIRKFQDKYPVVGRISNL